MTKRLAREDFGPLPYEGVAKKNYPYYCFDEQWLKEFVYYHLREGKMITLLEDLEKKEDLFQQVDLEYQRQMGNVLLTPEDEALLEEGAQAECVQADACGGHGGNTGPMEAYPNWEEPGKRREGR